MCDEGYNDDDLPVWSALPMTEAPSTLTMSMLSKVNVGSEQECEGESNVILPLDGFRL